MSPQKNKDSTCGVLSCYNTSLVNNQTSFCLSSSVISMLVTIENPQSKVNPFGPLGVMFIYNKCQTIQKPKSKSILINDGLTMGGVGWTMCLLS